MRENQIVPADELLQEAKAHAQFADGTPINMTGPIVMLTDPRPTQELLDYIRSTMDGPDLGPVTLPAPLDPPPFGNRKLRRKVKAWERKAK